LAVAPGTQPVVFAGASFGAVAAVTAALERPELVRAAIAMAGPFWWAPPGHDEGWLLRRIAGGEGGAGQRFHLFAGDQDRATIREWMGRLHAVLADRHIDVRYERGTGGHTFATWQERLPPALASILG
jgi:enterochelin esterase family protein